MPCDHRTVVRLVHSHRNGPVTYSWRCRECNTEFKPVVPGGPLDPAVNPFAV